MPPQKLQCLRKARLAKIVEARRQRREYKEGPTFCKSCVNEDEAEDATFDDFLSYRTGGSGIHE